MSAREPALPWPLGAVASRRSFGQVRRVAPVRRPGPPLDGLYATMRAELPLLAPVVLHAPSPPALTAAWALARETWLAAPVPAQLREAAVAGISAANSCPYCEQTHRMFTAAAAEAGDAALVQRYRDWGQRTASPEAGAPPDHGVDLAALAVGYHYLNRMVNVFLVPDQVRLPHALRGLRRRSKRPSPGSSPVGWSGRSCHPGGRSSCCPQWRCPPTCSGRRATHGWPPRWPARRTCSTTAPVT